MAEADYTPEIWKTIPFAPDYAVSDLGRVKRITDGTGFSSAKAGRILKPAKAGHKGSYLHLALGKGRYHNIHRLVALTFLGPAPGDNYVVAHIDGNGHNNALINLRWATQSENLADRLLHDTHDRGSRNSQSKLTEADVRRIRHSSESHAALGRAYAVAPSTIGKILRRERWGWLAEH